MPKTYECSVCGRSFVSKQVFEEHPFSSGLIAEDHGFAQVTFLKAELFPEASVIRPTSLSVYVPKWLFAEYMKFAELSRLYYSDDLLSRYKEEAKQNAKVWLTRFYEDSEALAVSNAIWNSISPDHHSLTDAEIWMTQVAELLDLPKF